MVAAVDLVVERDHLVREVDVAAMEGVDGRPQCPQHDLPLLLQRLLETLELFVKDVARHPGMLTGLGRSAVVRVILRTVSRCERVSTAAFRSMHPTGWPNCRARPPADAAPLLADAGSHHRPGHRRPATEEQLDDAIAAMAGLRYYVSVSPSAEPAEIGGWLLARGSSRAGAGCSSSAELEPLPAETSLELSEIGPERGGEFAPLLCAVYGLPEGLARLRRAARTPDWHCWLALTDDGEPAAAAALHVAEASLPRPRRHGPRVPRPRRAERVARGPHRAGPRARLHAVFTETGEQLPDRPSSSYRNIVRAGFEELYVLPNWLSPAP